MVGHNPGTNRLDFEWLWPKVKVTKGQNDFLQITAFKIVVESHDKTWM